MGQFEIVETKSRRNQRLAFLSRYNYEIDMINIKINPNDTRYMFIVGDEKELLKIEKNFNLIPQYQLLPTFPGIPTSEIYISRLKTKQGVVRYFPTGLWRSVQLFCEKNNIQTAGWDKKVTHSGDEITYDKFKEVTKDYINSFNLREYQIKAAWMIIKYKHSLSELCTRSGKTAIMSCVLQYLMKNKGIKKPLIIVPSIHLVKQGVKDFKEYNSFFDMAEVWAGSDMCGSENCIIGTFQSLVLRADPKSKKYDPEYFKGIDCVVVDEVHRANCKSIKTILNSPFMKDVRYKFGLTGTLPKEKSLESYAIQSLMGPKIQEITAHELVEDGYLADPIIEQHRITYSNIEDKMIECGEYLLSSYVNKSKPKLPEDQRRFTMIYEKVLPTSLQIAKQRLEKWEYCEHIKNMCAAASQTLNLEQLMTMFSKPRLDIMCDIISKLNKNIIIFAHNTEYIKFLETYMKEKFKDRKILKITGSTSLKKRQESINEMLDNQNVILIGSFGCVGTGLTFRNVDYGIFAQSFKSDVINRQSIGRLMLRTEDKKDFHIYDIIDVYPTKKLYNQGLAKIKTYKECQYRHEIIKHEAEFQDILLLNQ